MSNVESNPAEQTVCAGALSGAREPDVELLEPRDVPLGGPRAMLVRRSLPNRDRRMIGAWCFADFYGPTNITGQAGMQVPPHPHTGLQTVSWLLAGEVLHQDSLGSTQLVRPGELNLMTAGNGIAHAEQSPSDHSAFLHGVQLWVAQPGSHRDGPAHFEHHADLPTLTDRDATITVIAGQVAEAVSPAHTYSPLVGVDIDLSAEGRLRLPLDPDFEHGLLAGSDAVTVDGRPVPVGAMLYLGRGRRDVLIEASTAARALLIGGEPFEEELVMWWNFVGRSHEEVVEARTTWESDRVREDGSNVRFGAVHGYDGPALPAPQMPNAHLRARSRYRMR